MAHYLVTATPQGDLQDLKQRLESGEIRAMRPFGRALHHSLTHARQRPDGRLVWEEEDYCTPPLAMERAAVLDHHFSGIETERVREGEGWERLTPLPPLWPERLD